MCLISDKNQKTINIFKIKENKRILKSFILENKFEIQLNSFYKGFKNNLDSYYKNKETIKNKYNLLFDNNENFEEISEEEEEEETKVDEEKSENTENDNNKIIYNDYIKNGINKYEFKDSQKEFKNMKKLCFLFLIKYAIPYKEELLKVLIEEYQSILKKIVKLNYINQIKILICYTHFKIYDKNIKNGFINFDFIHLDFFEEFSTLKRSHNTLINIIDKINEKSCFFKGLQEINSLIEYDYCHKHYIFTGSLLTLNDVKLDIIKSINKFYFISPIKCNDYSLFNSNSEIITLFPCSFLGIDYSKIIKCSQKELNDNFTVLIFYVLVHEICGHMKKNINNPLIDSPNYYYQINLEINKILGRKDSGLIFENFIYKNNLPLQQLLKRKGIIKLLNIGLYTNETFDDLRLLISEFLKKEQEIKIKGYESPIHISSKKKMETFNLEDDKNENYDNYTIHELDELIGTIPEGMTIDQYKLVMKKTNAYKKLMQILKKKRKNTKC